MSAICMIRGANGVFAADDGVFYGPDGRLRGFGSKILLMPESSSVIVAQGMGLLLPALRFEIGFRATDFDLVTEALPASFESIIVGLRRESGVETNGALYVGGYSPARERFETYAIGSKPDRDTLPFTLRPTAYAEGSPWPDAALTARYGLDDPEIVASPFDIAARFLACARHVACPMDRDPTVSAFQVGGFAQVAMVTVEGCSTQIIHRWPDQVGEFIDPDAGPNCAPEVIRG